MTAVEIAIDAIFSDDNTAIDGEYTPAGGSPVPVRIIFRMEESPVDVFSGAGANTSRQVADIRSSEIVDAKEGDQLSITTVDGIPLSSSGLPSSAATPSSGADLQNTWKIKGARYKDHNRLIWRLTLTETTP